MNIKIASEKTGLTKKAIKYYESEGLISPLKRCENNYREYSDDDIVKLNLIGALRALDIPILDIKDVIAGKKSFQEILMESLTKINENINHLEKSKLIITSLIENNLGNYKASGEQIRKLRETLELSRDGKKEFISENLLRIFPGNFGQFIVAMYEPFLRITIDNDEKKKIWLRLVEFLDSADEIDEDTLIIEKINKSGADELDGLKKMMNDQIKNSLNCYENVKDSMINDQIQLTKSLKENEETKDKFIKDAELAKQLNKIIYPIQEDFEEYLCILNEDYRKYKENTKKIQLRCCLMLIK
ncbi:MerR family transcriptional regulator [Clostridium sp. CX1]|uniref:MerR family transcriptional regulator n=1 Tax=Clostridium sp. CX1 TaxID=2978346 RepID=UPI0021C0868D|nr:MerR family transcriptional regulator [Clostridium sp. CX1]MCT8974991.1 MerR family transcriptional regulator [Clostridium sp. CX1]